MSTEKLRPLVLSIRKNFPHASTASSSVGLSTAMRGKILERDDFSCVYCGFRSERFQEIRPASLDGLARQGRADDWVTVCHMCDQCLSLERTGLMGEGLLIWLPELTQPELNHIVRALYVARAETGQAAEAAKRAIDSLKARREELKRRLGSDDPLVLATALSDHVDDDSYEARGARLDGVRLLSLDRRLQRTPDGEVDRFPDMLAYWRSKSGPYKDMPLPSWEKEADRLFAE